MCFVRCLVHWFVGARLHLRRTYNTVLFCIAAVLISRFELLFMGDHTCTNRLRRLFFQNVMFNPVTGGLEERLAVFVALLIEEGKWDLADCMVQVLADVEDLYQCRNIPEHQEDP